MTTNHSSLKHDVAKFEAELRTHLASIATTAPAAIDALRAALHDGGAAIAADIIANLMPRRVDGSGLHLWLMGGPPPSPVKRVDPDAGRQPKALGERHVALAKIAEAKRVRDKNRERLAEAEAEVARRESDLAEADDRIRAIALDRMLSDAASQTATASMMGPMYTLARVVSPYLQVDGEFEKQLPPNQAEELARRREQRPRDSREILDLLDRYAGDVRLEINLQHEILKVLRDHHRRFQDETEKRRAAGIRSTERIKRRAIRRRPEEMRHNVHPAAPLVDAAEVFAAFDDLYEDVIDRQTEDRSIDGDGAPVG